MSADRPQRKPVATLASELGIARGDFAPKGGARVLGPDQALSVARKLDGAYREQLRRLGVPDEEHLSLIPLDLKNYIQVSKNDAGLYVTMPENVIFSTTVGRRGNRTISLHTKFPYILEPDAYERSMGNFDVPVLAHDPNQALPYRRSTSADVWDALEVLGELETLQPQQNVPAENV